MQFRKSLLIILFGMSIFSSAHAFTFSSWFAGKSWHPVASLGAGAALSTNVGTSQNVPIQNPVSDQFFNYTANHANQTAGLFQGFLGAEWKMNPQWWLQAGLDYNQATAYRARGTLVQGADIPSSNTYSYQYHIANKQLLFAGKLLYSMKKQSQPSVYPYIFAGLGAAWNKAYSYSTNVPPFLTFTRQYANNTASSFSYALGVGFDVELSQHVRAGVGYRFTDLGQVKLGSATIDTTNVSGTLSQSHFYVNELLAQLTWIFGT